MKLILTLLVRDEADIIRENILFHLNQGIDFIIATDNNSVDDTAEILRDFQKRGVLHYIFENEDDYSQSEWVTRMARMAINQYCADWVINADADEYWWPVRGNLKQTLEVIQDNINILQFERADFVPVEDENRPVFERMIYKRRESFNHLGRQLMPKVCHRALKDVIVGQGNHTILSPAGIPVTKSGVVEIFHFPMRSYAQFENKIKLGGAAYERNMKVNPKAGGGWRWLYERYKEGTLPQYYASKIITPDEVERMLSLGELLIDERLRDYSCKI
nr:glycosyltransferase family 2 protein [Bacteroidota bacterium]